jgi:tRNA 2-thiouridine synthesizing protein A
MTEDQGAGAATRRLDTRGTLCPVPVIKTAEAMRELAPGQVLEVLADDLGVVLDLPAWCRSHRQRLVELTRDGRLIRVLIMKTGESA